VTTRIPQLERQLVEAAQRRAGAHGLRGRLRMPRRRPSVALMFVVGFLFAAGTATAVLVARGDVGQEPTVRYGRDAPEAGMGIHYETRPVVLAAGRLPSGERFELVGYQQSARGESNLCIDITFPASGEAYGCGSNHGRAQGVSSGPGHPTRVNGATPPDTNRVVIEYTLRGQAGATDAVLLHVEDPEVIKRIRVDRPFGYYVAALPGPARDIVATGLDEQGRRLWEAAFYRPDFGSRRRRPDLPGRSPR
jgi:hypothetical protein